jgi:DNA-binding NarL/FixJ family response regulator
MAGQDLSAREHRVLEFVATGRSNKEIAAAMEITEATVKSHVTNILGKLGVTDRTQAVITALRRGLVHL